MTSTHTDQLAIAAIVHFAADPGNTNVPPEFAAVASQALAFLDAGQRPSAAVQNAARRRASSDSAARDIADGLLRYGIAQLA